MQLTVMGLPWFDRDDPGNIHLKRVREQCCLDKNLKSEFLPDHELRVSSHSGHLSAEIAVHRKTEEESHIIRWVSPLNEEGRIVDLSNHRGMGAWVEGDCSGCVLFVEWKYTGGMVRRYHWRMDFEGARYLELPNGEARAQEYYDFESWGDYARWDATLKWFRYDQVIEMALGLTALPVGKKCRIRISQLAALREHLSSITNPVITLNGRSSYLSGELKPWQYLAIDADGQATAFDSDWHRVGNLAVRGKALCWQPGRNEFRLAAEGSHPHWHYLHARFEEPRMIVEKRP